MENPLERFPHWPADELEKHLTEATKDPGARPGFLRAVLEGALWVVPLPESSFELKDGRLMPGGKLVMLHVSTNDKVEAIAAFTSLDTMTVSCQPGTPSLKVPTRDLFTITRGATIAVNPVGPYGKLFVPAEIEDMLGGLIAMGDGSERQAMMGSQVLIGSPAKPPTKLIEELRTQFRTEPKVRKAHLGVALFSGSTQPPHPIIGIDYDGQLKDLLPTLEAILKRGAVEADGPIDVIDLNNPSLGQTLAKMTQSFYTK